MKFPHQLIKTGFKRWKGVPLLLLRLQQQERNILAPGRSYGGVIYRFRWFLLAFWIIVFLGSFPFASHLPHVLSSGEDIKGGSEASQVEHALISQLHHPTSTLFIVFQSKTIPVSDPAYQHQIQEVRNWIRNQPHVITTRTNVGNDQHTAFLHIGFDQDTRTLMKDIPSLCEQLAKITGPAQLSFTGDAAIGSELLHYAEEDGKRAELIAVPLLLCVLFVIFRSVVASCIPIIIALISMSLACALIYALALHIEISIFAFNIISLVGLGLSIDYSLLLIHRFREELAREQTVVNAVEVMLATAGAAIFHSGLMVLLGFTGLLLIDIPLLRSFGLGGISATVLALLASLTLLPALLGILGERINRFSLPRLNISFGRIRTHPQVFPSLWQRWTRVVMAHPLLVLLLVLLVLLGLIWPALSLKPGISGIQALPDDSQAKRAFEILKTHSPLLSGDTLLVLIQTPDESNMLTLPNLQHLQVLTNWIATRPHITGVISLTQPSQKSIETSRLFQVYVEGIYQLLPELNALVSTTTAGDTTLIMVSTDAISGSSEEERLIQQLRSIPSDMKQGRHILLGGTRVANQDYTKILYEQSFPAFLFILLASFVALFATFRSPLLALKAILMNLLSLGAAYGGLVFVFQQGHFEQQLGFTATGNIDRFVPLILFCILFGLSMDYEVFLLSRIREEWLRTGDNRTAVALGLEKTGGVITSAALLLVIVSAAFVFTSMIVMKEFGLGITLSILVDATLIRCLLVPSMMQLMGRWNWWKPGFFSKQSINKLQRFGR